MTRSPKQVDLRASGRFVLRIEPGLHAALRSAAKALRLSLNEYCERKLALPVGSLWSIDPAGVVVARAAELLGPDLVGVVAFGSWARGEAGPESDVDTLLVIDAKRTLTRALYREWDARPLTWEGRAVEPHFVHLPDVTSVGSIWAEAAVDGIVLFERGLEISRRLAAVRREIVAGRLVRRVIHGQPYWAEVA